MTALKCGGQCTAQNEREETIYCSKVSWTSISASLNVYHRLLASEPCLAASLAASLSRPRYLTPLFSLFYSRSTLPAFIPSFTSNLCPLTSHFFLSAWHSQLFSRSSVSLSAAFVSEISLSCFHLCCSTTALILSLYSPSSLSVYVCSVSLSLSHSFCPFFFFLPHHSFH